MAKKVYLTKGRINELEEELQRLKSIERPIIAQKIAEARSHGDLRENADYDAAKDAQGHLELRIAKIQEMLANSQTIQPGDFPDDDKIYILSIVKLLNKKNNATVEYTMVSAEEADFEQNKLAVSSPIGKALMGKSAGDSVTVRVPAGLMEYEILGVRR